MSEFPLRHVSMRVPWHDAGWSGVVCRAPLLNDACAKLKRIADGKRARMELPIAGQSLEDLPREQWPCCVDERATFMAPFEMQQVKRHALAERGAKEYGHFRPTPQRYPAYSAGVVPFRWMMRGELEAFRDELELEVDDGREPELGYDSNWVHEVGNQTALLEGFAAQLREEGSLCFFYAKHVPFFEGTGRVLIGVGRVTRIGPLTEYDRSDADGMGGMVWERPIQHSIRPNGKDGFLMPYYEVLERAKEDPSLDFEPYVAHAPDEHWGEFSYDSELVTHDGAIAALLAMETALARAEQDFGIATGAQRQWVHDELVRLWKVRGPFPGLGAVLRAFGLSRGLFVAHALQQQAGENADPWPKGVRLLTVDRGVFPDDAIRLRHPLEKPSGLDSALDQRRARAFVIHALEEASSAGHTLQSASGLTDLVRAMPVRPECAVTADILAAGVAAMAPEVIATVADGRLGLQLGRYEALGDVIRRNVRGRVKGARHAVNRDWAKLLRDKFGPATDAEERRAREEKARALQELAKSRFAVLAGPAGTGKTSVLGILCSQSEIKGDGLLLLAPTGKARVRMQQLAGGAGTKALTIAQFLSQYGRYDGRTGRYLVSERPKATGFGTVIVDEASMLTEDMLGALLDALQGVKRLILVGDPAQLPPIGAGRPFVDIIAELRPADHEKHVPRVSPGYAELTIERRQVGAERPDVRLARWFSTTPPSAGEDDIFSAGDDEHATIRFVSWDKPEDFHLSCARFSRRSCVFAIPMMAVGSTGSSERRWLGSTTTSMPLATGRQAPCERSRRGRS